MQNSTDIVEDEILLPFTIHLFSNFRTGHIAVNFAEHPPSKGELYPLNIYVLLERYYNPRFLSKSQSFTWTFHLARKLPL